MLKDLEPEDILNLMQADEVSRARLSVSDREILDQMEREKEEQEKILARSLSDEEAETISNSIPGAKQALARWGEGYTLALEEVKKQSKELHQ